LKDVGGVYWKEGTMDEEKIRIHFEKANLKLVGYKIYDNFNAMVGLFFSNYATYLLIEAENKTGTERDLLLSNAEIIYRAAIQLGLVTKTIINGLAWVLFLQGVDPDMSVIQDLKEIVELLKLYDQYENQFSVSGHFSLGVAGSLLVDFMDSSELKEVDNKCVEDICLLSSKSFTYVLKVGDEKMKRYVFDVAIKFLLMYSWKRTTEELLIYLDKYANTHKLTSAEKEKYKAVKEKFSVNR